MAAPQPKAMIALQRAKPYTKTVYQPAVYQNSNKKTLHNLLLRKAF
jgi:hypothetical protein